MPMLSFKVTAAEAENIRARARREKHSLSEYLRRSALPVARRGRVRLVRAKHTGALIFQPAADAVPLNSAQVRALLADFP